MNFENILYVLVDTEALLKSALEHQDECLAEMPLLKAEIEKLLAQIKILRQNPFFRTFC